MTPFTSPGPPAGTPHQRTNIVHGTRRGGRHLPAEVGDYAHLDAFAAELSLELIMLIKAAGHPSFSDFLRNHMADSGAPECIAGDPGDGKAFDDAKRSMSKRLGVSAREIAEWDLIEFVLARTDGEGHAFRPRLAGLWQASQRYPPPGYRGPVQIAYGAPPPYAHIDEAPNDKVRVQMLLNELSQERDNSRRLADETVRELRQAHAASRDFYEHENAELKTAVERYRESERLAIRIIWTLEQGTAEDRGTVERRLHEEAIRLRREVEDLTKRLNREKANHNLTANRFAFVAACLDTAGTDPVRSLRDADFPLGADLYALLSPPATARARSEGVRQFLTVYLRVYLLTWFGDTPDRDDTVGPYRAIVRDGTLPSAEVLNSLLAPHTITLQVARPLMLELESPRQSVTAPITGITPKQNDHAAALPGTLDRTVNVVDVIEQLVRRPGARPKLRITE